jgi:vitamin B12 transporter
VGLEHELLPGGDLSLWATYFDQQFRDMILYDAGAAPGEPTYLNGAAAQARGVETGVTSSPGRVIEVSASYTYLAAEATDDGGMPSPTFSSGERLIRRPRHSAGLTLRAQALDRLSVGGSLTYVGPREDVDFNQTPSQRVELDGYAVVDLAAELEIVHARAGEPGISGTVRVENLLDEQYEQVVGFAGRPRAIFGGVRFRL